MAGEALAPSAVAGLTGREASGARRCAVAGAPPMASGAVGLPGAGTGWRAGTCSVRSGAAEPCQ
ncbi:hypothetical protein [Proteus mirabilis]|uniref:hypothetical protein n=1 Tax=Proteus mirabilis TaxID=584 RepID=UPI001430CDE1|nr:hypothetical protein [Proteus mirabilis]